MPAWIQEACNTALPVMSQLTCNWNMDAEPCYSDVPILTPGRAVPRLMGSLASETDFSCWQRSSRTSCNLFIPADISVKNWINRYTFVTVNTGCETANWKASTASWHIPTPGFELSEVNFSLVLLIFNSWTLFKVSAIFCSPKNSHSWLFLAGPCSHSWQMWNKVIGNKFWIQITFVPKEVHHSFKDSNVVLSQHLCLPFLFASWKCDSLQEPVWWLIMSPNLSRNSSESMVSEREIHQLEICTGDVSSFGHLCQSCRLFSRL